MGPPWPPPPLVQYARHVLIRRPLPHCRGFPSHGSVIKKHNSNCTRHFFPLSMYTHLLPNTPSSPAPTLLHTTTSTAPHPSTNTPTHLADHPTPPRPTPPHPTPPQAELRSSEKQLAELKAQLAVAQSQVGTVRGPYGGRRGGRGHTVLQGLPQAGEE